MDAGNGFANRFNWVCVMRSKELPEGGNLADVDLMPLIERLRTSYEFADNLAVMGLNLKPNPVVELYKPSRWFNQEDRPTVARESRKDTLAFLTCALTQPDARRVWLPYVTITVRCLPANRRSSTSIVTRSCLST